MTNYVYKCVPVPEIIHTGTTGKDMHYQAVSTYESLINQAASGGWELVQIDTVTSVQQPGCLAMFTGGANGKRDTVSFKLLVFKKPA